MLFALARFVAARFITPNVVLFHTFTHTHTRTSVFFFCLFTALFTVCSRCHAALAPAIPFFNAGNWGRNC